MAEPARISQPFLPDVSHLITEDDEPVDNFFQDKQANLLSDALDASWSEHRPFISAADVALFSSVHQEAIVPDVLLSLGVEFPSDVLEKGSRSYYFWQFGKPPDLVIEIVSNRTGSEDSTKLEKYANMRIPYYAIYDPQNLLSTRPIRIYQLSGTRYLERLDRYFPDLELGLCLWSGVYDGMEAIWLRWSDESGQPLPTGLERGRLAEYELQQANARAQSAEERAQQELQRRQSLEQRLRELGLEP